MNTLKKGTLKVGVNDKKLPISSRDSSGNLIGYDIDLIRAFAKHLKLEVEFVVDELEGLKFLPENNLVDVALSGLSQRLGADPMNVPVSDSYLRVEQSYLVRKEDVQELSLTEAWGNRIVAIYNESVESPVIFEGLFPTSTLVTPITNLAESVQDLLAGNIDGVAGTIIETEYYIAQSHGKLAAVLNYYHKKEEENHYVMYVREASNILSTLNGFISENKHLYLSGKYPNMAFS